LFALSQNPEASATSVDFCQKFSSDNPVLNRQAARFFRLYGNLCRALYLLANTRKKKYIMPSGLSLNHQPVVAPASTISERSLMKGLLNLALTKQFLYKI